MFSQFFYSQILVHDFSNIYKFSYDKHQINLCISAHHKNYKSSLSVLLCACFVWKILSFAVFQQHISQSLCFFSRSVMYLCLLISPWSFIFGSSGLVWDILVLFHPKCVGENVSTAVCDWVNVSINSALVSPLVPQSIQPEIVSGK